jgi:endo-1,4-beta-xylanase
MKMRSNLFVLSLAVTVFGCGGAGTELPPPDMSVGGGDATGGDSSVTNATGGAVTNPATGGSVGVGGSPATGGMPATGGSPAATGGRSNATGGARPTGGSPATGGAASTGGAIPNPTGGAATTATGGTRTMGSSTPSGGKSSTGGSRAVVGGSSAVATGGTPAAGGSVAGTKFLGNITTGNAVDPTGLKYSKYWDQITPENQGKWGSVQSTPTAAFNWGGLDSVYAYANTNNIIFKQHCFCWGSQQPSGTPTLAQVENWIKSFCARFPNTKVIDVVNEPPPHTTPSYTANLGAGEGGSYPWITKAFKLARQYCGNAVLILNDYNNLEYTSQESTFINIVKDIKANGAPIDAVGCQGHALKGMSAATVQTNLTTMNTGTGLPVYVTEFDIDDANDSSQATTYSNLIPVFWNASYVHGITVWGWIAGRTWETNSGIVNGTTPRPAMTWLMNYVKRPIPPN